LFKKTFCWLGVIARSFWSIVGLATGVIDGGGGGGIMFGVMLITVLVGVFRNS
jgi:hypothetical protein